MMIFLLVMDLFVDLNHCSLSGIVNPSRDVEVAVGLCENVPKTNCPICHGWEEIQEATCQGAMNGADEQWKW